MPTVPSKDKCEMMHLPTGTYVYLYTREGLNIPKDSMYPVRFTQNGICLPQKRIEFKSSSNDALLVEEYLRITKDE